jgi:DNA-binding SARP family transcriptional activator/TolB-like protein
MLERVFREPKFYVRCLGPLTLTEIGNGTDLTPTGRKTRALLGYLCLVGMPVARERLASLLWGDRGDEQARASLRQAIYELRSTIDGDRVLKLERETVAAGEDVGTDVAFILATAQQGNLEQLAQILSEWRGEFLEDLGSIDSSFDEWLQSERLRVQETVIDAAMTAVNAGMARGETGAARKIINLLQQRDPTNEPLLRLALQLDHSVGDSATIHRRYERFREVLKSELDAAPALETQHLFRELTSRSDALTSLHQNSAADGSQARKRNDQRGNLRLPSALVQGWAAHAAVQGRRFRGQTLRHRGAAVAFALFCACVLAWAVWKGAQIGVPSRHEPLLAVLPFQNLNADSRSRYFSDGITEEVIDALLHTTELRVVSPGSSFRFRKAGAAKAAKALAASHVLSGSIQRVGDRIHLIAQLTDMRDNRVVWSHAYDRAVAQVPALRRDIAVQIADALDLRLSPGSLKEEGLINPLAYDHYLKGRDLFLQRDLEAAEPEVEAATRLAPKFAKAWSTLAAVRIVRVSHLFSERKEDDESLMEKAAKTAANRALTLDPNNGEALAVLAHLTVSTHLLDIDRLYQRALRSEPNNTQLLNWHGALLWFVGRNREGLDELTRAYDIDRVTPTVAENLAESLLWAGRYEDAKDIIDLAGDNQLRTDFFQLHAQYFLFRRDWAGLAKYLHTLPDFLSPPDVAFFTLCRETAMSLAQNARDKFGPLRGRWRGATSFDSEEAVQFLYALGDADGALRFVESAVAEHRRKDRYLIDPGWTALFPANLSELRRHPQIPLLFSKWGLFEYWRSTDRWPDFCYEPGLPFDCKAEAQKLASRHQL